MSGQVIALIVAFVVGVPLVTWGLICEQERCDRERRLRKFLAQSPEAQRIKAAFVQIQIQITDSFTPALQKTALAMAEFGAALDRRAALADPETETDRSEDVDG